MEFEEIIRRVEWLDEQQRKSKADFNEMNGRLKALSGGLEPVLPQLKVMTTQIKELTAEMRIFVDEFIHQIAEQSK